jgi:hypothetical protein
MALLSRPRLRQEDRSHASQQIARWSNSRYRLQWKNLSDDEAETLVALCDAALTKEGAFAPAGLSHRDRAKFEELVERGCVGLDDGHFETLRRDESRRRETGERDAQKRRVRISRDAQSALFEQVFNAVASDELWADDASALFLVVAMFAAGRTLTPLAHFEGGAGLDAELRFSVLAGLLGTADGAGTLVDLPGRIDELGQRGWLDVARPGGPRRVVRLGAKTRAALSPRGDK